jgi:hypothetical protein
MTPQNTVMVTRGAMSAVAAKLHDFGFGVRFPADGDGRRAEILGAKRARSEIAVDDSGFVTWGYRPETGNLTDPADIVGIVLSLLGSPISGTQPTINRRLGLKNQVGEALRRLGLHVEIAVYQDSASNVVTEVVATNPAVPFCGLVRIGDDARITWECDIDGPATECALAVADTIVPILTHGADGMGQLWLSNEHAADGRFSDGSVPPAGTATGRSQA